MIVISPIHPPARTAEEKAAQRQQARESRRAMRRASDFFPLSRHGRELVAHATGARRAIIDGFERPVTGNLAEFRGYDHKQPAEPAHPYHPLSHPSGTVEPFDVVEARVMADLREDARKHRSEFAEREKQFRERFGRRGRQ